MRPAVLARRPSGLGTAGKVALTEEQGLRMGAGNEDCPPPRRRKAGPRPQPAWGHRRGCFEAFVLEGKGKNDRHKTKTVDGAHVTLGGDDNREGTKFSVAPDSDRKCDPGTE